MRFNYDLLPGERLTFEEIARRYALQYPDDKELTARALLSPSTGLRTLKIRAVFAREESNSPLEDLLFISHDNERKNYLRRFEHYLKQNLSFLYFRRSDNEKRDNLWKVMGSSQVFAMIDPQSATAQNLLNSRGYKLVLMHQDDEDIYWQLFNPQADPCFPQSQRIQFIVVLSTPQHKVPAAVMPGTEVGRRVKARVLQRASQAEFSAGVKARYGACVMTGTELTERHNWPWVEACHIDTQEGDDGVLADNSIDNGLFLRSDLQRLFINRLISIDAESGAIQVHPGEEARQHIAPWYQELEGRICSLWAAVPPATRQRLRARR
ncbi:HNH endonuclease [Pantoea sp. B550]|uniref:HNH endonuclease signature motif containing protein n=1 Tax=Pantoea TaxID=53335 RepID=UPI001376DD33|nr:MULTISPECIES: HNH endonuclease signature motif containing protein [Pantoea]MCP1204821.1 HNH endonuclease [Pantoea sp. B550]MCT2417690.1 HNH endonuclease [Pantoea sp. XY16]NBB57000.1 HNH endonuclease [Pantoea vagans]QZX97094.1 HNH endonuclease [Pantoea alfalfae]WIL43492.1 HNH endonuclease signature motif containing protein [Pantoea agglomerans]